MDMLKTLPRSERNPVKDLWHKYANGEMCLEELDMQVRRRCIDNLDKWYTPQVVMTTGLEYEKEKWLLKSLIGHNKSMATWLYECLKYAGLDKSFVLAKIDKYKQAVYRQQERLITMGGKNEK